ncbi:FAD-binding oxidoreductase [Pseudonocardia acaciae]|uniref:FAD-binding oxidoreductase n=1 Tax=Pseudonocardia acaciae TaxID=551276 RepID=UPI000564D9A0|nr:FAD-binding protein [Pseudonocardia acaciae]
MSTVRTTIRPADLAEAAAALADTRGAVLIRGAGTAADWAGRPADPELLLDTTGLTGVLAHNPADMTVEVRAGTPLRTLNAELAEHGQRVALDAARVADGATVGGLIATADSGPAALAYGSMRDLVIGAVVVLADGTVARTGGHVIKNVAGYDLAKLVHGAHGTLALIAEVVLRLHPLPAASATVRLPCALPDAGAAAANVLASPLDPAALEWCGGALLARLEGGAAALDARASRLVELLGPGAGRLDDAAADAAWAAHAATVSRPPERATVLRVGARPSRLPGLLERLADVPGAGGVTAGLATGIGTVTLPADPAVVAEAHRAVHEAGGTSALRSRPAAGADLPAWGPAPSALAVLRAVHDELDPDGRLGGGRFSPWWKE